MLLVNTCGFLRSAVEESLDAILTLARDRRPGQRLVVVGCLVGRYGKKLARSLPEVELLVGPGEAGRLAGLLASPPPGRLALSRPRGIFSAGDPRALASGPGWAYLRVADGCARRCHFCAIPAIRGPLRSRPVSDLVVEAQRLADSGVRELNLVAQDLTGYGRDLPGRPHLADLLGELAAIEGLSWLRMLYLHPEGVDEKLLTAVARLSKVLPYFDLPFQHVAAPVIAAMGRRMTAPGVRDLVGAIRGALPGAVLRATVLVGHPGEGEREFAELLACVAELRCDHLGAFAFSPEGGTRSARLAAPGSRVAEARRRRVMALQKGISREINRGLVGSRQAVLVLGPHPESGLLWHGRLARQAPDGVDGQTLIVGGSGEPGSLVPARITKAHPYDLEAELAD